MTDKLSSRELLKQLEVTQDNETVEHLCREVSKHLEPSHRDFRKAIELASHAEALSRGDPGLHGKALLYLSLARLSTRLPDETKMAIGNCERAITSFGRNDNNYAIAQIFRAQIDRRLRKWRSAIYHFEDAAQRLEKLIQHWQRHSNSRPDKVQEYQDLLNEVKNVVAQTSESLMRTQSESSGARTPLQTTTRSERHPVASRPARTTLHRPPQPPNTASKPSGKAAVGPNLIPATITPWALQHSAPSLPTGLELMPLYVADAGRLVDTQGVYLDIEPRYLTACQFSIDGQPYALRSVDNRLGEFRLRWEQSYAAVEVVGDSMEPTIHKGEYTLVRLRSQPDSDRQIVAVTIGHQADGTPIQPFIKRIRMLNGRKWLESDNPDFDPIEGSKDTGPIQILGVVEAVFTPIVTTIPQESVLPSGANRLTAPSDGKGTPEGLLLCIDDLYAAEISDPEIRAGIVAIRDKFQKYVTTHYGWRPINIILGQTPFDPNQGHSAAGSEYNSGLPEGVILHILSNGYLYNDKVVREAKVIVNQKRS